MTEAPPLGSSDTGEPAEPAPPPAVRAPAPAEPIVERRPPAKPARVASPVVLPEGPPLVPPIVSAAAAPAAAAELRLSRHDRKQAARLRARKVKRIVRRIDAWSVLKVSFIFYLCVYVVTLVAVVLLWSVASGAGVVDNIESFIEDLGAFETFEFDARKLFQGTALGGAILTVLATGLTALGAVLFNLISDLVGGIRLTVIEEPGGKPLVRAKASGRSPVGSDTVSEPSGETSSGL